MLWDPKFVAVVDRWSLFRGRFTLWKLKLGPWIRGCYSEVVVNSGLTVQRSAKNVENIENNPFKRFFSNIVPITIYLKRESFSLLNANYNTKLATKVNFTNVFTKSFCLRRSQKCKKTLATWLSFCTFEILLCESCT